MNCLIVDDNKIARVTIRQLAARVIDLEIARECENAVEAYNFLKENKIDLILLDIELPEMSGIELTKNLRKPSPLIIFITSKKEYAVEAFELNVVDYLVKPITTSRFLQAIEKAREVLASRTEQVSIEPDEFIFIRDGNIIRRIKADDILYAEAMGDYVKIHLPNKFYAIHTTLKSVEERLATHRFVRVHRSYIVGINKIDGIQDGALVVNGKSLPVADAYRSSLNKRLNIL